MLHAINNVRVVTPDGVLEGASVVLEEGRIAGVSRRAERSGEALDGGGRYVSPGIVDLHSDAIEKQLVPRPGVELSEELAFLEMDRYFATSGVTTGFHALSFMEGKGRSMERARGLCKAVVRFREEGLVRHEVHLRCELPKEGSVEAVEVAMREIPVGIVSIMDHTPGQGQFRDLEWFRRYWTEDRGADEEEIAAAIAQADLGNHSLAVNRVERLSHGAVEHGAVFASHDDDTVERVELLAEKGVRISEFPINAESARRAKELGIGVCMGAPNVVRGRSSGGNLGATEAIAKGLVDTLCSDYHPPSMLQAAFKLARDGVLTLPAAVALVTGEPARAAGLHEYGEIREGYAADLILVGERLGLPTVTHTVVGGRVVSEVSPDGYDPTRSRIAEQRDLPESRKPSITS